MSNLYDLAIIKNRKKTIRKQYLHKHNVPSL